MNFLQGKKTYISAAIFFLLGFYGIWTGMDSQLSLMAIVAGLSAVGLGAKADRYASAAQLFIVASHKMQMKQPLTAEEKDALLKAGVELAIDVNSPTAVNGQ